MTLLLLHLLALSSLSYYMGGRHSKTYYPDTGAVKSYKGLSFDKEDGSITGSVFQQIADGELEPGDASSAVESGAARSALPTAQPSR